MKKSRFSNLPAAQEDHLFETFRKFKEEKNENKINLSIGMLQKESGDYYQFESVKLAEQDMLKENLNKEYPTITGIPEFNESIKNLFFERDDLAYKEDRILVVQPVTGGASLRLVAELIKKFLPKKIHMSKLTFPPYIDIFQGIEICYYPYYNNENQNLDFENMKNYFENIEEHSLVLFQLSSHNPTALDIENSQWEILLEIFKKKKHLAIFDAAYLGYANGSFADDLFPIKLFTNNHLEVFICYSSAKNFTNYSDDIGALLVVLNKKDLFINLKAHLIILARSLFSFPSLYGARIINKIINSENLRQLWLNEQKEVYERIILNRNDVIQEMQRQNIKFNYEFLHKQKGIYMFLDLTDNQIKSLANGHYIFIAGAGRINLSGINKNNIEYFVSSLKKTLEN